MLLNAIECQDYNFYCFWVIKRKSTGRGGGGGVKAKQKIFICSTVIKQLCISWGHRFWNLWNETLVLLYLKKPPNSLYMMAYFIVKNKICGRGKPLIHQATLQKSGFEGQ